MLMTIATLMLTSTLMVDESSMLSIPLVVALLILMLDEMTLETICPVKRS